MDSGRKQRWRYDKPIHRLACLFSCVSACTYICTLRASLRGTESSYEETEGKKCSCLHINESSSGDSEGNLQGQKNHVSVATLRLTCHRPSCHIPGLPRFHSLPVLSPPPHPLFALPTWIPVSLSGHCDCLSPRPGHV